MAKTPAKAPAKKKRIGEVLRERGSIDQKDLDRALATQRALVSRQQKSVRLGEVLVHAFHVKKGEVAAALEEVQGVTYTECRTALISREAMELIPREVAMRCCALPLQIKGKSLVVVMAEPQNLALVDDLGFRTGFNISPRFGFREEIIEAIIKLYREEQFVIGNPRR
jgi:type IV pilus assembly protein PilB